jgi:PHS family inorganic phosphate transporter-like MFS transporter
VKSCTNWGNLVGQLGYGYLADKYGRKRLYGTELLIMILATICSILVGPAKYGLSILATFAFWRFILGIGIGGDYPMSAIITSEFATVQHRGMMIASVFALQGIGILFSSIVALATLAAMEPYIRNDSNALDTVWRILLGFGIVPAAGAVYFRLTITESPRYTVDVKGDAEQAARDLELISGHVEHHGVLMDETEVVTHGSRIRNLTFWQYFGTHFFLNL